MHVGSLAVAIDIVNVHLGLWRSSKSSVVICTNLMIALQVWTGLVQVRVHKRASKTRDVQHTGLYSPSHPYTSCSGWLRGDQ